MTPRQPFWPEKGRAAARRFNLNVIYKMVRWFGQCNRAWLQSFQAALGAT
jgi:hypothetical protein